MIFQMSHAAADAPRKYAGFTRNSRQEANISLAPFGRADKPVIKPMVDFINEFGFVLNERSQVVSNHLLQRTLRARRAHHLQNPQNRPWYPVCNRLADRPLGRVSCLQEP